MQEMSYEGDDQHDFVWDKLPDAMDVFQGVDVQVRKLEQKSDQAEQLKPELKQN
jgi:hypothetical protein